MGRDSFGAAFSELVIYVGKEDPSLVQIRKAQDRWAVVLEVRLGQEVLTRGESHWGCVARVLDWCGGSPEVGVRSRGQVWVLAQEWKA